MVLPTNKFASNARLCPPDYRVHTTASTCTNPRSGLKLILLMLIQTRSTFPTTLKEHSWREHHNPAEMLWLGRYTHPFAASFPTIHQNYERTERTKYINPRPLTRPAFFQYRSR